MTPEEELKEIDKMAEEWRAKHLKPYQFWPTVTIFKIAYIVSYTDTAVSKLKSYLT